MSLMIASRVRCNATVLNAMTRCSVAGSLVIVSLAVTVWSAVAKAEPTPTSAKSITSVSRGGGVSPHT
jgi:hypothetical protein